MNRNKWKKIMLACFVVGALVFSFWYGGDAPGLHGFLPGQESAEDSQTYTVLGNVDGGDALGNEASPKNEQSDTVQSADQKVNGIGGKADGQEVNGNRGQSGDQDLNGTGEKSNDQRQQTDGSSEGKEGKHFFKNLFMKIKQISSSKTKKNPQFNKKAQNNANKAAEKSSKKKSADKDTDKSSKKNSGNKSAKENQSKKSANDDKDNNSSGAGNDDTESSTGDYDRAKEAGTTGGTAGADTTAANDGADLGNKSGSNESDAVSGEKADGPGKEDDSSTLGSTESSDDTVTTGSKDSNTISCSIYISCASVLNHMDKLTDSTKKVIPEDGIILDFTDVKVKKNATVFDVLQKAARDNKVHLEYNYTPAYKTYYIEGIGNLYQFDVGNLSGWMYSVNGEFPGVGCSGYKVKDGDVISWVYTCNFGKDVGGYYTDGE